MTNPFIISKLGLHNLGSKHDGTGPFFAAINAAKRQLAFVDNHDDFGLGFEAARYWPGMLNIGDLTEFEASFDIKLLREHARLNPHITHWQVFNEFEDWENQANHLIAIMNEYGHEFKFVIFNCANGKPHYPSEDGGVAYANIARACAVAKAGGHMLGLHEYGNSWDGNTLLRYRKLASYLEAHNALCPIVITEASIDEATFPGVDKFMAWCRRYDAELMKDNYVVGAALWTLGGGWCDFHPALPKLADYIATVQPPIAPPPPDPTVNFTGHCVESNWQAVHDAAVGAGATIERV